MAEELRKHFEEELDELHAEIVRFGALVADRIPDGTEVLLNSDLGRAAEVIRSDDELDALTLELDDRIAQLIALQAPVAGDLRALLASMWMVAEIERSGDLVTNVAKAARRLYGSEIPPKLRGLITALSEQARELFMRSIDAYGARDAALGAAIDDMDDELDQLHRDFIEAIFAAHSVSEMELQAAIQLALVGRYYERIGDHAVNIGERVVYMVSGWLPEHEGAARAARQPGSSPPPDHPNGATS